MQVCFIGHRVLQNTETVVALLKKTIIDLINKGATTFLFGSKSQFNDLSWEIVTRIKEDYPFIKRVYVRAAFQYIDDFYKNHLLEYYDDTYFPPKIEKAGKYSYVERNYEMIDKSSYCIFYCNENKENSGTVIAYNYAKKKKKAIVNLYKSSV